MYFPGIYKGKSEEKILELIKANGFIPLKITNRPGIVYSLHTHPETKLIVILSGSMELTIADKDYNCTHGDKIIIAGSIKHSAVVGEKGCEFYWSEKLL